MLTPIADVLFTEREDDIWDSTTLFNTNTDGTSSSLTSSEPFPLLLSTPTISLDDRQELTLDTAAAPAALDLTRESWRTAAKESAEGVHYVRERFPGENVTYLSHPFRLEPILVLPNDKVVIVDEISEYAVRVRLLRDGGVGIIPSWNVEDPLERLARLNMKFNEIVTSPTPQGSRGSFTSFSNSTFVRRDSFDETPGAMSDYSPDVMSDEDLPLTPTMPETTLRKMARRVGFVQTPQKTIFRYPAPDHESEHESGDDDWWWDGWEESEEHDVQEEAAVVAPQVDESGFLGQERIGRPRLRRKDAYVA